MFNVKIRGRLKTPKVPSTSHKAKEDVATMQKNSEISAMQMQVTIEKTPYVDAIYSATTELLKAQKISKERASTSAVSNIPLEIESSLNSLTAILKAPSKLSSADVSRRASLVFEREDDAMSKVSKTFSSEVESIRRWKKM